MPAFIVALLPAILQLLTQSPEYVAEFQNLMALIKSNSTPTPEQQKAIDAALDAVYKQIQEA